MPPHYTVRRFLIKPRTLLLLLPLLPILFYLIHHLHTNTSTLQPDRDRPRNSRTAHPTNFHSNSRFYTKQPGRLQALKGSWPSLHSLLDLPSHPTDPHALPLPPSDTHIQYEALALALSAEREHRSLISMFDLRKRGRKGKGKEDGQLWLAKDAVVEPKADMEEIKRRFRELGMTESKRGRRASEDDDETAR